MADNASATDGWPDLGVGVDAPVVGAIITSGVALVVAVGSGMRGARQAVTNRRYERRQAFLVEAQDAMLKLRESLATYGVALQDQLRPDADRSSAHPAAPHGQAGVLLPGQSPTSVSSSFVLAVPEAVSLQVEMARGGLSVARSRLEDTAVDEALGRWETIAQASKIDPRDTETSAEEAAFAEVNELIRVALRTAAGG